MRRRTGEHENGRFGPTVRVRKRIREATLVRSFVNTPFVAFGLFPTAQSFSRVVGLRSLGANPSHEQPVSKRTCRMHISNAFFNPSRLRLAPICKGLGGP